AKMLYIISPYLSASTNLGFLPMSRIKPLGVAAIYALTILVGCTARNERLNDPGVLLEARQHNLTRAALAAQPTVLNDPRRDVGIRPALPPSTQPPGRQDEDGYFVGIAISGGGSRSANFAAACMFPLH